MHKSREVTTFEEAQQKAADVVNERRLQPNASYNNSYEEEGLRMRTYEARLQSFTSWPTSSPLSAESLARAGWYYINWDDRVRCAWCHGSVFNWEKKDTAMGEHHRHFPQCDFVRSRFKTAFNRETVPPQAPTEARETALAQVDWPHLPAVRGVRETEAFSDDDVTKMTLRFKQSGIKSKNTLKSFFFNHVHFFKFLLQNLN